MGIVRAGTFIDSVHIKGLQVSLVASGNGSEVIHHKLQAGCNWGLHSLEGWDAFEYLFIISGELVLNDSNNPIILITGDSFYENPVMNEYIFHANSNTEFLYVTSKPVFHHYLMNIKEMMDLAVAIEEKDGYTVGHCENIKILSMLVGRKIGLDSKQLVTLNLASFLHDVGKIKVPLSILQKPSKLTEEEWEIMKMHTTYGREILEQTGVQNLIDAGRIVEQHHERYDGKGYPRGLKGDAISLESSIISVADSFDAMTSDRVYQKGRSTEEAIEEIVRCKGTMYHPYVVDIFVSLKNEIVFKRERI